MKITIFDFELTDYILKQNMSQRAGYEFLGGWGGGCASRMQGLHPPSGICIPLNISTTFPGNVYDAMDIHNKVKFSTLDRDNDFDSLSCAVRFEGGWWYNKCFHSNINGQYGTKRLSNILNFLQTSKPLNDDMLVLLLWLVEKDPKKKYVLMKRVEMKIRPKNF